MKNRILFPLTIVTVLSLSNSVISPAQANTTIGENGITNDSGRLAPSFTPGESAASPAALIGVSGGSELFGGGGGGGSSSSAASAGAASAGAAAASAAAAAGAAMASLTSGATASVSLGG